MSSFHAKPVKKILSLPCASAEDGLPFPLKRRRGAKIFRAYVIISFFSDWNSTNVFVAMLAAVGTVTLSKKLEISHCEKEALVIEVVVAPSFWVKSQNNVILGEIKAFMHILVEHEFSIHIVFLLCHSSKVTKISPPH